MVHRRRGAQPDRVNRVMIGDLLRLVCNSSFSFRLCLLLLLHTLCNIYVINQFLIMALMSPLLSDVGNLCHTCARIWSVDLQKPEVLPVMRIDYHCSEDIVVGYCFCGGLRGASDGLPMGFQK